VTAPTSRREHAGSDAVAVTARRLQQYFRNGTVPSGPRAGTSRGRPCGARGIDETGNDRRTGAGSTHETGDRPVPGGRSRFSGRRRRLDGTRRRDRRTSPARDTGKRVRKRARPVEGIRSGFEPPRGCPGRRPNGPQSNPIYYLYFERRCSSGSVPIVRIAGSIGRFDPNPAPNGGFLPVRR
jgi:hypothetical protein